MNRSGKSVAGFTYPCSTLITEMRHILTPPASRRHSPILGRLALGLFPLLFSTADATPLITSQPANTPVVKNESASLQVSASGGTLAYQWFRGASGDTATPVPGATGALLVSPPVTADTTFWVRVSDGTGNINSQSATATLTAPFPARMLAMGYNTYGQYGDGTVSETSVPLPVANRVIQVAAGIYHSLSIRENGDLWCSGYNYSGQLGTGNTDNQYTAAKISSDVTQVSAFSGHSLFIKTDGSLWGMGANYNGQLGDGTLTGRLIPIKVADSAATATAGGNHSLFLKADGTLWAMGYNAYGQLGDGSTTSRAVPVQIAQDVISASAGDNHSLFVKSDGSLWAAGYNAYGQLGDGTLITRTSPVQVASGVARVAAGGYSSFFVKTDGSLWVVGRNSSGQLGTGNTTNLSTPVKVADGVKSVSQSPSVYEHTLFLKTDNTLWGMGDNSWGQLGGGTSTDRLTPVQTASAIASISAGGLHSLIRDFVPAVDSQPADIGITSGSTVLLTVSAYGAPPLSYQWYAGTTGDTSSPVAGATGPTYQTPQATATTAYWVRVSNPWGSINSRAASVQVVSAPVIAAPSTATTTSGENASLNVSCSGGMLIYQWFQGASGDTSRPLPGATSGLLVTPPLTTETSFWVRVSNAAGFTDSPTIVASVTPRQAGYLRAVGSTDSGQLGTGVMTNIFRPSPVATGVAKVSSGDNHTLFLKTDNSLWAMGLNSSGQLGDGTSSTRRSPVSITTGVSSISAGPDYSVFVKTGGTLWIMGGGNGSVPKQMATGVSAAWAASSVIYYLKTNGTLVSKSLFGAVSASETTISTAVSTASACYHHVLFIKTDGTLWTTGTNEHYEMGTHQSYSVYAPIQLASDVSKISAGVTTTYFVKTDGTLWALGKNTNGQTGMDYFGDDTPFPIALDSGVADVAANGSHVMFIKTDGSLWGIGLNSSGQLGDGTASPRPTPVLTARQVIQISAGALSTLFVTADGVLWGTGSNKNSQLGGGTAPVGSPAAPVTDNVVAFSAGYSHNLILKADGSLWANGSNENGQLGDGTRIVRTVPVPVSTGVSKITAGYSHSLFIKTDGTLWSMGKNSDGQLGDGTRTDREYPVMIATDVICASAGGAHSLFIKTDGTLWGMGRGSSGNLGNGTNASHLTPFQIASGVVTVAAGFQHSLYLKTDGSLWGTGYGYSGQLGDGAKKSRYSPVMITTGVNQVAAGGSHSLFQKSDGSLWAMGDDSSGQLGDNGGSATLASPIQVATGVVNFSAGYLHSLFVKTDGTLLAMGNNASRQLGDGTTTSRYSPVQVATGCSSVSAGGAHSLWLTNAAGSAVTAFITHPQSITVASGGVPTLSVAAVGAGTLTYQWYTGLSGDISQPVGGAISPVFTTPPLNTSTNYWVRVTGSSGFSNSQTARVSIIAPPTLVTGPVVTGIVPGGGAWLSVSGSGGIFSYQWFSGVSGDVSHPVPGGNDATLLTLPIRTATSFWVRLGNSVGNADSPTITVFPQPVAGRHLKASGTTFGSSLSQLDGAVIQCSTSSTHSMYVKSSGTLWALGSNSSGQFGNGTVTSSSIPVKVAENVISAATGSGYTLFIKNDHTLWAAGNNGSGQLGDGTKISRSNPVLIANDVATASADGVHSLYVKTDGSLWAMGNNSYGQLGDNTTQSRFTPVHVADSVVLATAGGNHSLFVKNDGSLWGMGLNGNAQLGPPKTYQVTTPVKISDGVAAAYAGDSHSLFIKSNGSLWSMGNNRDGQLGYGEVVDSWTSLSYSGDFSLKTFPPHLIATGVTAAAAGYSHSLWLKPDGSLWSVGSNYYGQLGIATGFNRPPSKTVDRVGAAAAGGNNSLLLIADTAIEPPAIVNHPLPAVVFNGNTAALSVMATGGELLAYQWYSGATGDITQPIAGATSPTYLTPPVQGNSQFWVKVSNSAAYSESRTATLVAGSATSAYQEWAAAQGLAAIDIAPTADPDGDLRNNLLEYATGSAAGLADTAPPLSLAMDAATGQAVIHLQLRGDPGLHLNCLLTSDFASWQTVPLVFSGDAWSSGNPLLQITAATPGEGNLWNLTLRQVAAPQRLFLTTSAEMTPSN